MDRETVYTLNEIVPLMIGRLKQVPDGYRISTSSLFFELEPPPGALFQIPDFWKLHRALFEAALWEPGLTLDMSGHEDRCEGLPYNLDFVVRNGNI